MATVGTADDVSGSPFQSKSPEPHVQSVNDAEDELDFEEGEEDSQDNQQQSNKPSVTTDNETGDSLPTKPHGREDCGEEGQVDSDEDLEEGELKEDDEDDGPTDSVPPKEVCKYYYKGQCTWGEGCRFLHEEPLSPALLPRPTAPRTMQPMHILKPPLINNPRASRDFYPPPPLLPLPGPPVPQPSDQPWDRAARTSSKDRQSKSKTRPDYPDASYPEKRSSSSGYRESNYSHSNYYSGGSGSSSSRHHFPSSSSTSSSHPPLSHSSSSYRDSYYKSPSPRRSHPYSTASSTHHSSSRDYNDVSEYERRRRQAVEVAPRPDEWERSDRYGRDIETRHGHYSSSSTVSSRYRKHEPSDSDWVDKWQPRPTERGSNLSSISSSDSPARLSRNLSDSDSTGSWSDLSDKGDKEHTKRTNYRTRPSSSSLGSNVNTDTTRRSTTTSGMKRIPKLSERNRPKPPSGDEACPLPSYDDTHGHDNHDESRPSRLLRDGDKTHEGSISRSSFSSGSAMDDVPRKHRHSNAYNSPHEGYKSHLDANVNDPKRPYDSESESFASKRVRNDLDENSNHSSNPLSPQVHKEKFHMDFVGKVRHCVLQIFISLFFPQFNWTNISFFTLPQQPRIKPTSVLESKSTDDEDSSPESPVQRSQSSEIPSSESSTGAGTGGVSGSTGGPDKSIERQKLLEQLKAVEAAINAKKGKNTKTSGPKKRV